MFTIPLCWLPLLLLFACGITSATTTTTESLRSCDDAGFPLLSSNAVWWTRDVIGDRGDGTLVALRTGTALFSASPTLGLRWTGGCSPWRVQAIVDGSGCDYIIADTLNPKNAPTYLALNDTTHEPMLSWNPFRWKFTVLDPVLPVMTCMQCGNLASQIPCSPSDAVYGVTSICPPDQALCRTTLLPNGAGVVKGCIDTTTAAQVRADDGVDFICGVPGCNNDGLLPNPLTLL